MRSNQDTNADQNKIPRGNFRARLKEKLKTKVSTRIHMSIICITTIGTGFLLGRLLYFLGVQSPVLRYGSSVLGAYFAFFVLVYFWLELNFGKRKKVLSNSRSSSTVAEAVDVMNLDPTVLGRPMNSHPGDWKGEGGSFSGGGASENWGALPKVESGKSAIGNVASVADSDEIGAVIFIVVLVLAIAGSSFYLIIQAPEILFEAAFETMLIPSIIKNAKTAQAMGWKYSIFKSTWIPFLIVFVLATSFGIFLKTNCPEAATFSDYKQKCINKKKEN